MDRTKVEELTGRLYKVAYSVKEERPDLAKRIVLVADWLSGDTDESRYMKRYDYTGTYQQDSDEKFMDTFDDKPNEAARHSEVRRRTEGPVKDLNTDVKAPKNPHESKAVVDYHWASALKKASGRLDQVATWVQEQGDKKLAFRLDQIADQLDAEHQKLLSE